MFHKPSSLTHYSFPSQGIPDITTRYTFNDHISQLKKAHGPIAIDTERADGKRYYPRAYLIQIKRENSSTFLIDPIENAHNIPSLAHAIKQEEWILHDAPQDLPCLSLIDLQPSRLFDTFIAGALLGLRRLSLQKMLEDILNVHIEKEHTAEDWSMRPIPQAMRSYAALDVEFLHPLRHELIEQLQRKERLSWVEEECTYILHQKPRSAPKEPWRKLQKKYKITNRRSLAMLQLMWNTRDRLAQKRDIHPTRIISNENLAYLASKKPRSYGDVRSSKALRSQASRPYAQALSKDAKKAWALPENKLPSLALTYSHANPHVSKDKDAHIEILKHALKECASHTQINPRFLLTSSTIKDVAREEWKRSEDVENLLRTHNVREWQIELLMPHVHQHMNLST
ncbi:MAG: HRDC domain-containing protein [Actinomycetaceae bacterium]|nr:HRDC domain-containing protein [Actinomycetaceae bacterium]